MIPSVENDDYHRGANEKKKMCYPGCHGTVKVCITQQKRVLEEKLQGDVARSSGKARNAIILLI